MTEASFRGLRIRVNDDRVVARWGARCNVKDGVMDLVHDRQFVEMEDKTHGTALRETIGGRAAGYPNLIKHIRELVKSGRFHSGTNDSEEGVFTSPESPAYSLHWEAQERRSFGYLYIGAALVYTPVPVEAHTEEVQP